MSGGALLIIALLCATVAYILYLALGWEPWGWLGTATTSVALITVSAGLITRGTRAGHWPLTNRFEFALGCAWAMLAFYLLLERGSGTRSGGAFVLPLAVLLTFWAARRPAVEQTIRPLPPALQSGWFPIHVGCSAIAYGAFAICGGFGAMFLFAEWQRRRRIFQTGIVTRLPSSDLGEYLIWRAAGLGFPWLTLGMLSGGIWAQAAWGRYWGWDPKESWTLITWLIFLVLLHGRALQGWRGRRVAWLAVIGAGAVLFTFLGVGWLVRTLRLESLHIF